jgi:metal-dependent hydrolase (beta-lactamase superfamily II)
MCSTGNQAEVPPAEALPASAERKGEVLPLEPVDELTVLIVCDNTMDLLLPDEGPARRLSLAGMGRQTLILDAPVLQDGKAPDAPLAQHGFSALVEIRKGGQAHRLLFDTGLTPAGCVENLRRLGQDPAGIEAIICSHGHFDHTTGLSGLIGRLGPENLPVLIDPRVLGPAAPGHSRPGAVRAAHHQPPRPGRRRIRRHRAAAALVPV